PEAARAASGLRFSARTRQPSASRRSATAPPTPPVAPITSAVLVVIAHLLACDPRDAAALAQTELPNSLDQLFIRACLGRTTGTCSRACTPSWKRAACRPPRVFGA